MEIIIPHRICHNMRGGNNFSRKSVTIARGEKANGGIVDSFSFYRFIFILRVHRILG